MLAEQLWPEPDGARLVYAMHVAKARRDAKVERDLYQGVINVKDFLGLGIEGCVVDIIVDDSVLFVTSNVDFQSRVTSS